MRKYFIILLLLFCMSSCHQFVYKKHLMKDYYLIAVDSKNEMCIALELKGASAFIGRIDEIVFEIGFNERFIIAKQYPHGRKNKINYFILDTKNDSELEEIKTSVIGPMTEAEYKAKLEVLGISKNIKFSLNLQDLFN